MKACIVSPGGPQITTVTVPQPQPNEIQVRVRAAGVNRADLHVAAGQRHGSQGGNGTVIGMEWAGEISALGSEVPALFQVGDAVMCSGRGAYAEYAVADWGRVYKIPQAMGFVQAAALPIALQTAHEALASSGGLRAGETVLVQGASSGVGLMSLQVARHLGARQVIGTSTTAARRNQLARFGATLALDSKQPGWPEQVLAATDGNGCDLVIDFVAGPMMNANMQATRVGGRIVNVGRMGGFRGEFDFDLHSLRRIQYIGVTFRTRSREQVRTIAHDMQAALWAALSDGQLRMPISHTFSLDAAAEALQLTHANAHFGKVVLTV